MKITITWKLYTDGDFSLRNYKKYNGEFDGLERYFGMVEFEDEDKAKCMRTAKIYLEKMLCDIKVLYSRYYAIREIYDMFSLMINFVEEKRTGKKTGNMDGDYYGTEITVVIQ